MNYTLGIDLGGSSVKAVAVSDAGETLHQATRAFERERERDWMVAIQGIQQTLTGKLGQTPAHIGFSAPGLTTQDHRAIAFMPGRLAGLEGADITSLLGCATPVPVLNDAHAALLGERWLGAARGCQNVILFTLGTGVGGAAMVDGRLLLGHLGRAGHLGHISLNPDGVADITGTPGSLEDAIGNCTISQRTGGKLASTHELIAAHRRGDADASAVWLKSVKALAAGICGCINVLDPEAVIIGGGIARAGRDLFAPLEQFLSAMEWQPGGARVRIIPAELGEFAGAYGAAYIAIYGF